MAGPVRLADIFQAPIYLSYTALNSPEKSKLIASGIVARNATLDAVARAGSKQATVPFWQDIDASIEPNYSNDDPSDLAVPNKIGTASMTGRKAWVNQGFSEMDLVTELSGGGDALQQIRNRFGVYWIRQQERRLIASCVGILADNVAANAGDMVEDISAEVGDAAILSGNTFIDAAYQLGEDAESLRGVAVHSSIMARWLKADAIEYVPDSAGKLTIPTYMGKTVVVSDQLPVEGSGADRIYTSILFGTGSFGFGGAEGSVFGIGEGIPKVAAEVLRSPRAGNGGGMEELWERHTWMLHPFGFSWTEPTGGAALVEFSPTLADLRRADVWSRVVERRQVPLAFIRSKA